MADVEEPHDSRFDDIDLESILARVERRGPLTFTRKRCLYRAPEFVKKLPKEEIVEEGSTVKFECKAVGFPKPTVNWTKDLEIIPDNPRITFQNGELGEASIEIQKIKKFDEGSYRCKAENAEGTSTTSIYITIKVKPKSPKRSQERVINFTSVFQAIPERVDEEEKEAEEFMNQPISPLTYLYDHITIREKSWPDFLGNWAFLTSDFDGFDDNIEHIEDEDVFLPGVIVAAGSPTDFVAERDPDNSFDNVLDNVTIPNLIFENKNLVNRNIDVNLNESTDFCDRCIKDENANKVSREGKDKSSSECSFDNSSEEPPVNNKIQSKCDKSNNNVVPNGNIKGVSNSNHKEEPNKGRKDDKCSRPIQAKKDISSSQKRPLVSNMASSLQRPLQTKQRVTVSREEQNVPLLSFNFFVFIFVVSGLTLLALSADVMPFDFVFTIFVGQLIYLILKYLCGDL